MKRLRKFRGLAKQLAIGIAEHAMEGVTEPEALVRESPRIRGAVVAKTIERTVKQDPPGKSKRIYAVLMAALVVGLVGWEYFSGGIDLQEALVLIAGIGGTGGLSLWSKLSDLRPPR